MTRSDRVMTSFSLRAEEKLGVAFFRRAQREGHYDAGLLACHSGLNLVFVDVEIGVNVLNVVVLFQSLDHL